MENGYLVKLDGFEGPLDLLLHLVNQYEIDMNDIPVAQITEQYMNYIHTLQQLELNVASEYLVMAASLLAMKSQLLLPNQTMEPEEEIMEEDPREDLMKRLIEYKKYKEAAASLQEREHEANQVYTRPAADLEGFEKSEPIESGDVSVFDMVAAMQKVFDRNKWNTKMDKKIEKSEIPIKTRMDEVMGQVRNFREGISFQKLFSYPSRSHMVVTFMAVLELMKENRVQCKQENHFDDLMVYSLEGTEWS